MKKVVVAVIGATGLVGQKMIEVLEERNFPLNKLIPIASESSAGKNVRFKDQKIDMQALSPSIFTGVDFALFSAGSEISLKFAPIAAAAGAVVIDNSSAWRMDPEVPLVVPEVNAHALHYHKGIIANPNCSTIQMIVALHPLHQQFNIRRIVISTYQGVTGSGKAAVQQLEEEIQNGKSSTGAYPHPIAYNCLPHIDIFFEDGYTKEEHKMINETRKIMSMENFYPMRLFARDHDETFVGRIRRDPSVRNGLNIWIVSDNLRKGAATNAVQIAEYLLEHTEV
jgi:aspartate-semialdehyde dehydrogenase